MLGLMTVIVGVGAVEGTAPLTIGVLIATTGICLMFWGLCGMAKKGQLDY
jgi:hypothetical protein